MGGSSSLILVGGLREEKTQGVAQTCGCVCGWVVIVSDSVCIMAFWSCGFTTLRTTVGLPHLAPPQRQRDRKDMDVTLHSCLCVCVLCLGACVGGCGFRREQGEGGDTRRRMVHSARVRRRCCCSASGCVGVLEGPHRFYFIYCCLRRKKETKLGKAPRKLRELLRPSFCRCELQNAIALTQLS